MNIKGKLLEKHDIQNISDSFRKREFIVEYTENSQYPEFLKFELIQSNCDQLDSIAEGADISVTFNLKGRKWTNKQGKIVYFNSLQAWKVEAAEGSGSQPDQAPLPDETSMTNDSSADDDLPF